jgi:malonate decarboxylase epsilon subunit
MSVAFLFPGQGSQHPGFLHTLPGHATVVRTLQEASDLLGRSAIELDSEEALRSTVAVQLALLVAGVASARMMREEGVEPEAVAGLSVGAFGAAVACGALAFADSVRLVQQRATLMERAFPHGYGLSAIVGLTEPQVAQLVQRAHSDATPVFVGNINAPRQIVIAGADAPMRQVIDAALALGARKAERLPVAVPSHCPLLAPVAEALRDTLRGMTMQRPAVPYIGNVRARVLRTGDAIAEDLASNIAHGVRWYETTAVLTELDCRLLVEMQPGHVLRDLATEAFPDVRSVAMDTMSASHVHRLARLAAAPGEPR